MSEHNLGREYLLVPWILISLLTYLYPFFYLLLVRNDDHDRDPDFNGICDRVEEGAISHPTYRDFIFWDINDPADQTHDPSEHGVSKMEAYFYYYGLRGKKKLGPKLIYRTSKDIFSLPSDPSQDLRTMELCLALHHEKLDKEDVAKMVIEDTIDILDCDEIYWANIDLVRFRQESSNNNPSEPATVILSATTIWIRVHPESTNGDAAFRASQKIFETLETFYGIDDIDIAFRED